MISVVDKKKITKNLFDLGFNIVEFHNSLGSTNERASELIDSDIDYGIVVTENQSAGKGRGNRSWEMKPGAGLAISYIIKKLIPKENALGYLAGLGALATSYSLEKMTDLSPSIKWPNDLLINGKKFCGILSEGFWKGNELEAYIIGIGMNISPDAIPENVNFPATAIENHIDTLIDRGDLIENTSSILLKLLNNSNSELVINEWENRLDFRGKVVQIVKNGSVECTGVLSGLDEFGGIIIKTDDKEKTFYYGELHLAVK